jgi:hypothetical protein
MAPRDIRANFLSSGPKMTISCPSSMDQDYPTKAGDQKYYPLWAIRCLQHWTMPMIEVPQRLMIETLQMISLQASTSRGMKMAGYGWTQLQVP